MKKLLAIALLLITTNLYGADTKLSELTETTIADSTDLLYIVDGSTSKKITVGNLENSLTISQDIAIISSDVGVLKTKTTIISNDIAFYPPTVISRDVGIISRDIAIYKPAIVSRDIGIISSDVADLKTKDLIISADIANYKNIIISRDVGMISSDIGVMKTNIVIISSDSAIQDTKITILSNDAAWTKSGTNVSLITSTNNVGIGTATPGSGLSVRGTISQDITAGQDFMTIISSDGVSPVFIIDKNNRVGIGTSTPAVSFDILGKFQINGSGNITRVNNTATDFANGVQISVPGTNIVFGNSNSGSNSQTTIKGGGNANSNLSLKSTTGTGTTDYVRIIVGANGATEALRVVSSGRIGIGKTTPAVSLDIAGQISTDVIRLTTQNASPDVATLQGACLVVSKDVTGTVSLNFYNGSTWQKVSLE